MADTRAVPLAVSAGNEFALALYQRLAGQQGNLFFSPLSLRTTLAMALTGARGETSVQMARALRWAGTPEDVGLEDRAPVADGKGCAWTVANSLWLQIGTALRQEFLAVVASRFRGTAECVDFQGDPEAARRRINRWVSERTRERIRELVGPGAIQPTTRLVLANAVFFKGWWQNPFEERATEDRPFHLEEGGTVLTPMMSDLSHIRYLKRHGTQMVEIPYRGDDLSMVVILPRRPDGLRRMKPDALADLLEDGLAHAEPCMVSLFLPRFRMAWGTFDLVEEIQGLGVELAFDASRADFSGMNGRRPPDPEAFFISAVLHQAFVDVNETGTEAAAASAVAMTVTGWGPRKPPQVFRADRPFLFAIRDRRSGAILFMGRLVEPTEIGSGRRTWPHNPTSTFPEPDAEA